MPVKLQVLNNCKGIHNVTFYILILYKLHHSSLEVAKGPIIKLLKPFYLIKNGNPILRVFAVLMILKTSLPVVCYTSLLSKQWIINCAAYQFVSKEAVDPSLCYFGKLAQGLIKLLSSARKAPSNSSSKTHALHNYSVCSGWVRINQVRSR